MCIVSLILVLVITYEGYKILPKYLFLRKRGVLLDANISKLQPIIGSFGVIPKVNYKINNIEYQSILPVYSSFFAQNNYIVGNRVQVLINPKKNEECVIKSDKLFFLQGMITILIYSAFVYFLFKGK